jgi:hypothetical protein
MSRKYIPVDEAIERWQKDEEFVMEYNSLAKEFNTFAEERHLSMNYTHTPPMPGLEYTDARDAAYDMANILADGLPTLIRNDADRDAIEAALRDLIVNFANGHITPDGVGIDEKHYDSNGNQP